MPEGSTELVPISFPRFGGLRLDLSLDEIGGDDACFLRDVDWDGSLGKVRSRDGFQKLKAAEASGTYKALYPHSALRMIALKRIKSSEAKLVTIDREGAEKKEIGVNESEGKWTFASIGAPGITTTYMRSTVGAQKVVKYPKGASEDEFSEPTISFYTAAAMEEAVPTPETGKKFPCGKLMVGWPDANVLVVANTSATGGPKEVASSESHVWFSVAGKPEEWRELDFSIVGAGDGEEISALVVWGGQLYVFKETKFFVFSPPTADEAGLPNWGEAFREVSLGIGARLKRASSALQAETSDVVATGAPTGVYFCTTDGVYVTTGGPPTKISQALKPLEETVPFEGPMAEELNGESESFRWPATGILALGQRIIVRRYEFMFIYDIPTDAWTCWKMPAVSMAIWTGLTGGGGEGQSKGPATAANDNSIGTAAWSNINNIKVADGSYAEASPGTGQDTQYAKATKFGFTIPEGSTISGIVAGYVRKDSNSVTVDNRVSLVKAGTVQTTNKALPGLWSSLAFITYGGAEDLWGTTWTAAQINAETFGVVISGKSTGLLAHPAIDGVTMTVYYQTAEASSGVRPRLFCTQSKSIFYTQPNAEEQSTYREPQWQSGFYGEDAEDEKTFTLMRVWGKGTINVAVAKDLGEVGPALTFACGEDSTRKQENKTQTAVMFSHRISGAAPWEIQRLVRYTRESRVAGTVSEP